jgi:phage shock protein PspC (stress-responsive transcriptional regulator)
MSVQSPLRRSNNRVIAGVCAGVAEWLGWDPTVVRVIWAVATFFSAGFPGGLLYVILWLVMPT